MKDYTSNTYCDFLWINELLELKRDASHKFYLKSQKGPKPKGYNISHVTIFGTIVEIKQFGYKEFFYLVDDGTGVIACKQTEEQFESIVAAVENEQVDILNQTLEIQQSSEQSLNFDTSADDSLFNDKSVLLEEININKKNRLRCLQSIWDDMYNSFNCLVQSYCIGDSVIIEGKLYSYLQINQIYINSIRLMDFSEEVMMLTVKLEGSLERDGTETESGKPEMSAEKRFSGLMTFDNITSLNAKVSIPRNIVVPELNDGDLLHSTPEIVTPNLEPIITFDTLQLENEVGPSHS